MDTPEHEGSPKELNPFLGLSSSLDEAIQAKYKEKHPSDEARRDAFRYGVAHLAYSLYESLDPMEGEPSLKSFTEEEVESWQKALGEAKNGNWQGIKDVLQKAARLAISAGGYRLDMAEHFGWEPEAQQKAAMESDDRGQALTNLANSIL